MLLTNTALKPAIASSLPYAALKRIIVPDLPLAANCFKPRKWLDFLPPLFSSIPRSVSPPFVLLRSLSAFLSNHNEFSITIHRFQQLPAAASAGCRDCRSQLPIVAVVGDCGNGAGSGDLGLWRPVVKIWVAVKFCHRCNCFRADSIG